MAMKRGYPGGSKVRKSKAVGPDYANERYRNPWNAEIDSEYEMGTESKTLESPTAETIEHAGQPLIKGRYDRFWEGK